MNLMNKIRKEVKKVPRMTEKEKDELYFLMEDILEVSDSFAANHNFSDAESFEMLKVVMLECIRTKLSGIEKTLYESL